MTNTRDLPEHAAKRLRWPLRLTYGGLLAESVVRAFWPFWTVLLVVLAVLMLGVQDVLPLEAFWGFVVLSGVGLLSALFYAARAFVAPTWQDAASRLDETLPERPIAAMSDTLAIGDGDAASEAVWQAHLARMAERLKQAKAAEPDLQLATRDRYGVRYIALTVFVVALLFGSLLRVATVTDAVTGNGQGLASGPSWEGWVEPPIYTGKPSLYLNDIDQAKFAVPEGSRITLRFYGAVGDLALHETVSGRTEDVPPATDSIQSFDVLESGEVRIDLSLIHI